MSRFLAVVVLLGAVLRLCRRWSLWRTSSTPPSRLEVAVSWVYSALYLWAAVELWGAP